MGTGIPQMELDPNEADMLGEAFANCVRVLPSKKMKAVEAKLDAIAPWLGLVGTLALIGYPRWRVIQLLQSERARHATRMNGAPIPFPNPGSAAGATETDVETPRGAAGKAPSGLFGSSEIP